MKNILIIHHGQGIGGGLIALLGLIDELKNTHNVKVLSIFDGVAVDYLRNLNVEVIVPRSKFYNRFYSIFIHSEASYFGLVQQLLKFKSLLSFLLNKYYFAPKYLSKVLDPTTDVVYLNSTFISDWAYASKKIGKKVIVHVREPLSSNYLGRTIIRNNIKKYTDKIIAITHDNANRVNLPLKTEVVYDPVYNTSNDIAKKLLVDENYSYFAYVGGEHRIKGFEQFVKSLDYLDSDIKIYFLGGEVDYNKNLIKTILRSIINPYYLKYICLKRKLHQSQNVIMVGLVNNVFSYLNNVKFLISPFSKPHASLPILEAFSIGLPVITSDVSSMDELVTEKNGFRFKNGNYKELASCINIAAKMNVKKYEKLRFNCYTAYNSLRKSEKSINTILESL